MEDTGLIRHGDQSGGNSSKDFRKTRKALAFFACLLHSEQAVFGGVEDLERPVDAPLYKAGSLRRGRAGSWEWKRNYTSGKGVSS